MKVGFKRHWRAVTVPGDGVYLTSARATVALRGDHIETVAPLLDGSHDLADLHEQTGLGAADLGRLLGRLSEADLVAPQPDVDVAPEVRAYWDLAGLGLPDGEVEVVSLGDSALVERALKELGLRTGGDGPVVVVCDDYLDPALASVNAARLADGRPWLPVAVDGPDLWIGPGFRPGESACWECLATRLRLRRQAPLTLAPPASLPQTRSVGAQIAATRIAGWLAGRPLDTLWTFDPLTLEAAHHPVTRRPQCPECGTPDVRGGPVRITSRPKVQAHRSAGLQETWDRYVHLTDPVTGVTDEIRRDPRAPAFLNAYLSGRNLALPVSGLRANSGGKGGTPLEARVGALCEAVERYCGSRLGEEPVVHDSYRGLGAQAVHPDAVLLFDPRQRAPFDETRATEWTPLYTLDGEKRYLPTDLLYFSEGGQADSNGNAAGSSVEDALLQGFFELVERDAVGIWWYNRTRQPEVVLDDPWTDRLRDDYATLGRDLWVLDLTTDLGIPAMAAVSTKDGHEVMLGFGAHLDPETAARRALTELGQLLPAATDIDMRPWWGRVSTLSHPCLLPDGVAAPGSYTGDNDLKADVDLIRKHDPLILDQTRPDIGVPVVKVVVPGLRHFWPRFAPGRLFDVPVKLGRLDRPTAYDDLNPVALFM
ncbi:TOMM precursor leader peptide-binding protein [Herbidospora cretacea]|uniref:TOMM precursor leader peptide-binding protein n=1 Tax=Herbidospora cretacea TaxID=28444 RepID=UPI000773F246|nr:TOMM precursor leader peptide-binding protein [Herbidospora cretacea]